MGKRKTTNRQPAKKPKQQLPKIFDCRACSFEQTVTVSIDREANVGNLRCRACGETFQQVLRGGDDEPVDVYANWQDDLDDQNRLQSTWEISKHDAKERMKKVEEQVQVEMNQEAKKRKESG